MKGPELVVMAAGMGSRYGGLKQIDPIGPSGEIVLDYAVYDAKKAGFEKVVFIIREEIEDAFRERVGKTIEKHIETEYVFQELSNLPAGYSLPETRTKPWGTAHAILCAADAITGPFAAINADDFYGATTFEVIANHLKNATDREMYDYAMVGFELRNTLTENGYVSRGICQTDAAGNLTDVVERTKIQQFDSTVKYTEDDKNWVELDPAAVTSMNVWGFTQSFLTELRARFPKFLDQNINTPKGEFFIPAVVNELIKERKATVKVLSSTEKWLGVTYPEDKAAVVKAIQQKVANGDYPENLWT